MYKCNECGWEPKPGDAVQVSADSISYFICGGCGAKNERPTGDWKERFKDQVNSPQHYADHYPVEVIEMIKAVFKSVFGDEWEVAFKGYMLGNELKYRLRAGFKEPDKIEQDIQKSLWYNKARREG